MALQSSGQISKSDIQTEFGGSSPIAISEYYGAASGIPTSGTISMSDFYGASAIVINLNGGTAFDSDFTSPYNAEATFSFRNDGTILVNNSFVNENWADPTTTGIGSDYEIRATLQSGTIQGTFGSWLNLATNRVWFNNRTSPGTTSGSMLVEIRPVGGSVVASASYTITAEAGDIA